MVCLVVLSAIVYTTLGFVFLNGAQAFSLTSTIPTSRNTASKLAAQLSPESFSTPSEHDAPSPERRMLLSILSLLPVTPALAADDEQIAAAPLLQVTVTLSKSAAAGEDLSNLPETSALYITARPNAPDNVPRAILDGSRGKPPPVLIARIPNVRTFPFEVTLSSTDVTVEGSKEVGADYWWKGSPLVVSARLDSDGVAATRDPSDLVGRSIVNTSSATVELQGRGAAGKFFTNKQPPPAS